MKKILSRFFLHLAALLFLASAGAALAADYEVTGTTDVNGRYTLTERTQDEKQVYSNGTYDLAFDISNDYWQIQPKGTDNVFTCLYYDDAYTTSDTPPLKIYTQYEGASEDGATVAEATGAPTPKLTFSKKAFFENTADDGTLAPTPLAITLTNDTFTGDNGAPFDTSKVTVSNLPAGFTATITKTSNTELSFALSGTAETHDTDITNLTVSFTAAAFANTDDASKVEGAETIDLTINFIRNYTVGVDGDFTTLKAAIADADARDILTLTGTFTECDLTVDKLLTLTADPQTKTTIQAFDSTTEETNKRLFTIGEEAEVTLSNLILRNSVTTEKGSAGIYNKGTLTLSGCLLANLENSSTSSYNVKGGAIYNIGSLIINGGRFEKTTCSDSRSMGGAIFHFGVSLTIENATFVENSAASGGSIYIQSSDNPVLIQNTTFSKNSATKSGGALMLYGDEAHLTHATFFGNTANSVQSKNEGGGALCVKSGKTLRLSGSFLAGNQDAGPTPAPEIKGAVTSGGHNLVSAADGSTGITHGANNDLAGSLIAPLAPGLAPVLADGVHHLLADSPAINKASTTSAPAKDQLGATRTGTPDIGAVEYVPSISGTLTVSIAGHTNLPVSEAAIELEGSATVAPTATGFFRLPLPTGLSGTKKITIISPALDTLTRGLNLVKGSGKHLGALTLTQTAVATAEEVEEAVAEATEGLFTQAQVTVQVDNAITSVIADKDREKEQALSTQRATLLTRFDGDGDGKVGLENAIRALEIVAGIREQNNN